MPTHILCNVTNNVFLLIEFISIVWKKCSIHTHGYSPVGWPSRQFSPALWRAGTPLSPIDERRTFACPYLPRRSSAGNEMRPPWMWRNGNPDRSCKTPCTPTRPGQCSRMRGRCPHSYSCQSKAVLRKWEDQFVFCWMNHATFLILTVVQWFLYNGKIRYQNDLSNVDVCQVWPGQRLDSHIAAEHGSPRALEHVVDGVPLRG